jgi:hypothetical protein
MIGHASFFGAVMSEQAVRTTEAMMAVATSSLRRIIGVSPKRGRGVLLPDTHNVRVSADAEMAFSYQKMSVFYQKQHFFYH